MQFLVAVQLACDRLAAEARLDDLIVQVDLTVRRSELDVLWGEEEIQLKISSEVSRIREGKFMMKVRDESSR